MNLHDYQRDAKIYALFPLDNSGWDYLLSAMPEELGEFWETGRDDPEEISEAGDLLWNISLATSLLDEYLPNLIPNHATLEEPRIVDLVIELGKFSGIFAKNARKGLGRNLNSEQKNLALKHLANMLSVLKYHFNLKVVASQNINKLEERMRTNTIEGNGETVEERRGY